MKKSLDLLIEKKTGKLNPISESKNLQDDVTILKKTKKIKNPQEREVFLIKQIEKSPDRFPNSCVYLINLIKKTNPYYSYELAIMLCRLYLVDPSTYILLSKIAIEDKAWKVAKSALEVAKWFSFNENKDFLNETVKLLNTVSKKIKNSDKDNSYNWFWKDKTIEKLMVLLILYYSLDEYRLFEYSIQLLESFPEEKGNFEIVYEVLSMVEDNQEEITNKFISYIKSKNNLITDYKNLLLGMCYYALSNNDLSINYLEDLVKSTYVLEAKFYLALNFLIIGREEAFISTFNEFIQLGYKKDIGFEELSKKANTTISTFYIIWLLLQNKEFKTTPINEEKLISFEIARTVKKLTQSKKNDLINLILSKMKEKNYYDYLPSLTIYLAEFFIKENKLNIAKEILNLSSHKDKERVLSWISRIQGDPNLAEENLKRYREKLGEESINVLYKMLSLKFPKELPNKEEEILNLLVDSYEQTKKIKTDLALEYGINRDTCFETNCSECCRVTYPFVSYTEYLYLRKWLDSQSKELRKKIKENSKKIINTYKERYKKEPPFLKTGSSHIKDYPLEFTFTCPCLSEDGKCMVYEAQPFICRAYGYASQDRVQFNGCNYFLEQFKAASSFSHIRKVIDTNSFKSFATLADKKLIDISVEAPLPVWLAEEHELTLWNAKHLVLSRGIFKPIFDYLTKIYKNKLKEKGVTN